MLICKFIIFILYKLFRNIIFIIFSYAIFISSTQSQSENEGINWGGIMEDVQKSGSDQTHDFLRGKREKKGIPPMATGVLPSINKKQDAHVFLISRILPLATNWILSLILALSVLVTISAGIMLLFNFVNSDMKEKAKSTLIGAIVGVIVSISALWIVQFVVNINWLG